MFDRENFYRELDTVYATHDFAKIETYLKDCEWNEINERDMLRVGCPSCASREKDEYLDRASLKNRITIQNELLSLYRGTDHFEESVQIAEQMKEEMKELELADTDQYAIILLNEATTFEKMGDAPKAEKTFQECEELLLHLENADQYLIACLYNNRAPMFMKNREFEKAKKDLEAALQILKELGGKPYEEATTLVSIAIACSGLGNYAEGENAADEAIAIYNEVGEDSHMGAVLNIKAQFLYRKKEFAKAAAMFRSAAEITKKYFGENQDYRVCMGNAEKAEELA